MAAAALVEEVEDIQMGMMTIQRTTLGAAQEAETTPQAIPVGMIIQGLDVAVQAILVQDLETIFLALKSFLRFLILSCVVLFDTF